MKKLIYNCPNPTFLLSNFIRSEDSLNGLNDHLETNFFGVQLVGIESHKGDGGSHLLNALANEIRKRKVTISFLHFDQSVQFSDLTDFHLREILWAEMIFIDHIHLLCSDSMNDNRLLDFLKEIRLKSKHLFYSCPNANSDVNSILLKSGFVQPNLVFTSSNLTVEQRKKWANEKFNQEQITKLTSDFYSSISSNGEFLQKMKAELDKYKKNH